MVQAKSRAKRGVDKSDLLDAAFQLYAEGGEEGFSVRKLGAVAGVDPMTVLHHFGSKFELLRCIADHAVTTVALPNSSEDWRGDLMAVANAYRELAHRYPRVMQLHFKFHGTGPADHMASEVVYAAMLRAGLKAGDAAAFGLAFYAFVLGFSVGEAEGLLRAIGEDDEDELRGLDEDSHQATLSLIPAFKTLDGDHAFQSAMSALIFGIANHSSAPLVGAKRAVGGRR
jgi:AcrR family transcriptional regulator